MPWRCTYCLLGCCRKQGKKKTKFDFYFINPLSKTLNFKFYGPFWCMGFNCFKTTESYEEIVYFLPLIPRSSWYSSNWDRKDGGLNWIWSHAAVFNLGPMDMSKFMLLYKKNSGKILVKTLTNNIPFIQK